MESLFKKVGFTNYYYENTCSFYRKFFTNENDMQLFFQMVFQNDEKDKTARRMMNQVVRWIELADDLAKLRPNRDSLEILCIRSCIESLCGLYTNTSTNLKKDFEQKYFFEKHLSEEGKQYILSSFRPICYKQNGIEENIYNFSISEFELIIFEVRNSAVHEGDYWSSQLFSSSREASLISSFLLKKGNEEIIYETDIEYTKFIHFFVEAAINFISKYLINRENCDFRSKEKINGT